MKSANQILYENNIDTMLLNDNFNNNLLNAMERYKEQEDYLQRINDWMLKCFGEEISKDVVERNHRFLEEALELVQSLGCKKAEAYQLVDYVYNRPIGEPSQEVGGVMVTLAALCNASKLLMIGNGEGELKRISTPEIIEKIRRKQATKPKHSPLPENVE